MLKKLFDLILLILSIIIWILIMILPYCLSSKAVEYIEYRVKECEE